MAIPVMSCLWDSQRYLSGQRLKGPFGQIWQGHSLVFSSWCVVKNTLWELVYSPCIAHPDLQQTARGQSREHRKAIWAPANICLWWFQMFSFFPAQPCKNWKMAQLSWFIPVISPACTVGDTMPILFSLLSFKHLSFSKKKTHGSLVLPGK